MRNKRIGLFCCALIMFTLVACGNSQSNNTEENHTGSVGSESVENDKVETELHNPINDILSINVNDYMSFEVRGCNGKGEPRCIFDSERFFNDYKERLLNLNVYVETESTSIKKYRFCPWGVVGDTYLWSVEADSLESAIEFVYSRFTDGVVFSKEMLANGDKVEVSFSANYIYGLEAVLGAELEGLETEFVVSGLKELTEVDPFKSINIPYINYENGKGEVASTGFAYIEGYKYTFIDFDIQEPRNQGMLSNGDKIKISLPDDFNADFFADRYGIQFTRKEAEIEVRGLNAYGQPGAGNGDKAVVNLKDYVYLFENDYEKAAKLYVRINSEKLICDYRTSISENIAPKDLCGYSNAEEIIKDLLKQYTLFYTSISSHEMRQGINWWGYNVKNGDVVSVIWEEANKDVLEHLQRLMNIEFILEDFEYEINNLKETKPIDVFAEGEIKFWGTNGNGHVRLEVTVVDPYGNEEQVDLRVETENDHKLKNGDVIKVKISELAIIDFIYLYGYEPINTEIEITVTGLV